MIDAAYLVAAANERPTRNVQEAHILGDLLPTIELRGFNIPIHFHVSLGWTHILAESYNVDVDLTELWV